MTPQLQVAIRELQQTVDRIRSVNEQKKALREKNVEDRFWSPEKYVIHTMDGGSLSHRVGVKCRLCE